MTDSAKLLINGKWRASGDGTVESAIDPASGAVVGEYHVGTMEDMHEAIGAARRAFQSSDWAHAPRKRSQLLLDFADRLEAEQESIAQLMSTQNGKLVREARHELHVSVSELRYYAGLARNIFGKVSELEPSLYAMLTQEPLGVAGIIVPWNAPSTLLIRSLAPALAAGCTCIVKPADQTAVMNARVFALLDGLESLPAGVVNVVAGPVTVSEALVQSEDVDVISYTGSTHVGKLIMASGAATLKRMNLELGGSAPCLILEDADLKTAVAGISRACFAHAGQVCMAASRVFIPRSRADEFQAAFSASFAGVRLGLQSDADAGMGTMIDTASRERVLNMVSASGAEILVQGEVPGGELAAGAFLSPSLLHVADRSSPILRDEIFGPVMSLIIYDVPAEAIAGANDSRYGLCASVWTGDLGAGQRVAREIQAGTVWINHHMRTHAEIEVGGFKESGIGRLHGVQGLEEFMHCKNVSYSTA